MSLASIMLEDGCEYDSTTKHAISFVRILFNNNFRSIHVWRKSEITNRRPEMHYDVIFSLPAEVRTWVNFTSFGKIIYIKYFYFLHYIYVEKIWNLH